MKKIIILLLCFVFIMSLQSVFATESKIIEQKNDLIITPFWENTKEITGYILVNDGKYSGYIRGNTNATKITMTLVLSVKNSNGTYTEVSRTSSSSDSNIILDSKSYTYTKGKTYKLTITGKVYVGSSSETITKSITATY